MESVARRGWYGRVAANGDCEVCAEAPSVSEEDAKGERAGSKAVGGRRRVVGEEER